MPWKSLNSYLMNTFKYSSCVWLYFQYGEDCVWYSMNSEQHDASSERQMKKIFQTEQESPQCIGSNGGWNQMIKVCMF